VTDIGTQHANEQGVAPETDLVLVGLGNYLSTATINEGIEKIFAYADQVGKPCVVSISLGGELGLHDGSDSNAKLIASLTQNGEKPGRVVLVSSSNAAANWQSIVHKLNDTTTELKTVLGAASFPSKEEPDKTVVYNANYCFYADDYQDFDIKLKVVNLETGALSDVSGQVLDNESGEVCDLQLDQLPEKTITGATAITYYLSCKSVPVRMKNPDCRLALVVKAKKAGQTIKMMCNGDDYAEPCFDAPNEEDEYNFKENGYTKGNGDIACNVMVCNDAVISVGSYITTTQWNDYNGSERQYAKSALTGNFQEIGEISDFSSYCIDDNGKPRPTVIAPGQGIFSAASNWDDSMFKVKIDDQDDQPGVPDADNEDKGSALENLIYYEEKNNRKNWYVLAQGTSMSCPHAAGIVALWMQAKPTLTSKEIQEIMKATCVNDEFTTNIDLIPSRNKVQAGFGKIDCLAGLQKILNITGIEAIEVGGHREATPSTMYSVDAPVYNMMGQRVDKNTRGFVIYKGRKYVNK
jgi:subtilisin family serine protease